ncbi:response regulator [Mastigocoleus testarum]|uniref:Response regulator receiver protein n=1 Tax=Mastigocoleus testarum BC008 TaxID=371196 RepID=A0A0V7ZQ10_9CYAN|nr:response regulator [Mastigocoleus testarum]KST66584.1 response regulator receiver protein [Mastigocoleus testarum BC008]
MSDKPLILTVDRNRRNLELLKNFLIKQGYEVISASNLDELDRVLSESNNINLVLLDVSGFDQNIWIRCEQLKNQAIPFLIISAKSKYITAIESESLARGASSILVKPLVIKQLLNLIRSLLRD